MTLDNPQPEAEVTKKARWLDLIAGVALAISSLYGY